MNNHQLILFMLQLSMMYNAVSLGWKIKKINSKGFILSKKIQDMTELDNNTIKLLGVLTELNETRKFSHFSELYA